MSEWVKCSERLPCSMFQEVLLFTRDMCFELGSYVDPMFGDKHFMSNGSVIEIGDVTHWMPLPEAPKEGE